MSGLETKKSEKFLKKTRIVSILQLYQKFLKDIACTNIYFLWQCFLKMPMRISKKTVVFKNFFWYCLLEKWGKMHRERKSFGTLLWVWDLSKASACLNHELHNYLSDRKARVKTENILRTWMEIVFGVP